MWICRSIGSAADSGPRQRRHLGGRQPRQHLVAYGELIQRVAAISIADALTSSSMTRS
jgi:hypothetical protein